MLPLRGIGFLERGEMNSAAIISPSDALLKFMSQIYVPKDPTAARLALVLANKIISSVPLIKLRVNMEPEAALVARDAFVNKKATL